MIARRRDIGYVQVRSQNQNSREAPVTSKWAHIFPPPATRVVTKSPSQPITDRGSGGPLKAPPAGSGAEPQPLTMLVHFGLKWKHLVQ